MPAAHLYRSVLGLYVCYALAHVLRQHIFQYPYVNKHSNYPEQIDYTPATLLLLPSVLGWAVSAALTRQTHRLDAKQEWTGGALAVLSIIGLSWGSFLCGIVVENVVRGLAIVGVTLVGTGKLFRKQQNQVLSYSSLATALASGVCFFYSFKLWYEEQMHKQFSIWLGIALLLVYLAAQSLLPEYFSQFKSWHPQASPYFLMLVFNKSRLLLAILYTFLSGSLTETFDFALYHPTFAVHLLAMGLVDTLGQLLMFRLVVRYRQHIAPLVAISVEPITTFLGHYLSHGSLAQGSLLNDNIAAYLGKTIVFVGVICAVAWEFRAEAGHWEQLGRQKVPGHDSNNQLQEVNDSNSD